MTNLLRLSILCAFFATACSSPKLLLDSNKDNLRGARTVAMAFYESYGSSLGLKDIPFVTAGMEGGSGLVYDASHNVLFVTPYEYADFDTQKYFGRASASGNGKEAYNSIMFDFMAAHQLMHLVYDRTGLNAANHYQEETHINAMTWLFLKRTGFLHDQGDAWLNTLGEIETRLVSRYPDAAADTNFAQALEVTNNATYWYVTAVSVRESYETSKRYASEKSYLSTLVLPSTSAQASVTR